MSNEMRHKIYETNYTLDSYRDDENFMSNSPSERAQPGGHVSNKTIEINT